jgi:hypothetical protein
VDSLVVKLRMDWFRIFSKSLALTIALTILFPVVQIAIKYFGVVWFAPLPPSAAGMSYWGVPWGYVTKAGTVEVPYLIEWSYLVYDLTFWFVISFVYYSVKGRRKLTS